MPQRRRTAFADILRAEPDPPFEGSDTNEAEGLGAARSTGVATPATKKSAVTKRNKAISSDYTKLTAYIPRTLAAAIKMSMALDQTADQSAYIERAVTEWLRSTGKQTILSQAGHSN